MLHVLYITPGYRRFALDNITEGAYNFKVVATTSDGEKAVVIRRIHIGKESSSHA